jgi:hypothetical protein
MNLNQIKCYQNPGPAQGQEGCLGGVVCPPIWNPSESFTPKYAKAADCLSKDRDMLLAFYDFPAGHWKHLRTTDEMDKQFLAGS